MTILETNIILLKKVPEELQTEIQSFIMSKIDMTKNLKPLNHQEIYKILDESSRQAQDGRHRSAKKSLDELRNKYSIIWNKIFLNSTSVFREEFIAFIMQNDDMCVFILEEYTVQDLYDEVQKYRGNNT